MLCFIICFDFKKAHSYVLHYEEKSRIFGVIWPTINSLFIQNLI